MTLLLDARQRAMLLEMGVRVWMPSSSELPLTAEQPEASKKVEVLQPVEPESAPGKPWSRDEDWQSLTAEAARCTACGLCNGRRNSTLREPPSSQATWMVVGDPPEDEDDRAGRAFAGESGVLLDNMLRAVGASRNAGAGGPQAAAYVTHVVKCRPPRGQVPQGGDITQCAAFLDREIALVQPRILLAAGRFAISALLRDYPEQASLPLGKQRGTVYRYRGIPVVVTYSPQSLLRRGADKAKAWADLCLGMDALEGTLPTMPP